MFYGFDGTVTNDGGELLHQLLHDGVGLNRLFSGSLPLTAAPRSGLGWRFLLGCLEFDVQL